MRPRRSASSSIVPGLRCAVDERAAVVEPAGELLRHELGALVVGHVGEAAARRQAVEVDEVADAVRQGVGQLQHQAAALGVADDRHRRRRRRSRAPPPRRGGRPPSCRARRARSRRGPGGPTTRPASRRRRAAARTRRRCRRSRSRRGRGAAAARASSPHSWTAMARPWLSTRALPVGPPRARVGPTRRRSSAPP